MAAKKKQARKKPREGRPLPEVTACARRNGLATVVQYGAEVRVVFREGVQYFFVGGSQPKTPDGHHHARFLAKMLNGALRARDLRLAGGGS